MTDAPGTYALLLHAKEKRDLEVGAVGEMTVRPGLYVYVGSAFGPGGLRARVKRHIRGDGALHWHVDYLRAVTTLDTVWYTHDAQRRECTWAEILRSLPEATVSLDGFGASDCDCPTHLVRFDTPLRRDAFWECVQAACANHKPIHQQAPAEVT